MPCYLTRNGYAVPRAELTPRQAADLERRLTVTPVTGAGAPAGAPVKMYPVFRKTESHYFVPRCDGFRVYGPPKRSYLPAGEDFAPHVAFAGALRDYQAPVLAKFLEHVRAPGATGCGLLELYTAWGKTMGALWLAAQLGKKTLIIVHLEPLGTQWVERIQTALPGARIGWIQGAVFDIEDKDIVICMLQTLYSRDFPVGTFDSFGLTVVDECHHISSECFSRALFKIVTPYMLGLSATMERKDGTSNVFKMFLGEVVHKAERPRGLTQPPEIRGVFFSHPDAAWGRTIAHPRTGQVMLSTMVARSGDFAPRTLCILHHLEQLHRNPAVSPAEFARRAAARVAAQPPCAKCGHRGAFLAQTSCCRNATYCFSCLVPDDVLVCRQKRGQQCPFCPSTRMIVEQQPPFPSSHAPAPVAPAASAPKKRRASVSGASASGASAAASFFTPTPLKRAKRDADAPDAPEADAPEADAPDADAPDAPEARGKKRAKCGADAPDAPDADAPDADAPDAPEARGKKRASGEEDASEEREQKRGKREAEEEESLILPRSSRHTIVLSNSMALLCELWVYICERGLATAGFHIGAKKKHELAHAAACQIILATYAAASEGLDIPSLNAQVLATPKSDVVQTVGRILRAPHPVFGPVIIDIIDQHRVFRNQWAKRKRFFVKSGYAITTGQNCCIFKDDGVIEDSTPLLIDNDEEGDPDEDIFDDEEEYTPVCKL